MHSLLVLITLFGVFRAVESEEDAPRKWKSFPSPNGHYLVRLREGWAIGNCKYDRAELIDRATGKKRFDFAANDPYSEDYTGGGYEEGSVVWSPSGTRVAVYHHDHRGGEPQIVVISRRAVRACTLPEITLPHEKNPVNEGRWLHNWLEPKKWLSESVLLLSNSGDIEQHKGVVAYLRYDYALQIAFRKNGGGYLKSIKRVRFDRDP